jgi:hypothetical protein
VSETWLKKVFLNELHTVRFLCQSDLCRAVVEVQISQLANMLQDGKCPVCGADYLKPNTGTDLFLKWKAALVTLAGLKDNLKVELVIPAGGTRPSP